LASSLVFAQGEENLAVVKRFYEELSAGNVEVILEVHTEMVTLHHAETVQEVAIQNVYQDWKSVKAANPDLRAVVHDLVGTGDLVIANVSWLMTHTGDYFGLSPTGLSTIENSLVVRRLEQGKIVESWDMTDDLGFLNSLGYVASWDELTANPPTVCSSQFEATVHSGPSAGLSLNGNLRLVVKEDGSLDGQLTLADGSKVSTTGQATGKAINLMLTTTDNQQLFGVGTASAPISLCSGVLGGPFVGPLPGDSGDWVIEPIEGGTEEPPADDSGDDSTDELQTKPKGKPGKGILN
jgi:predicted ester cyclase